MVARSKMAEYRTQLLGSGKRLSQGPPERLPDVELVELTAKWQDRLRLLNWDIEVGYLPACKMYGVGQAECLLDRRTRTAKIHIVEPATANEEDWPWDTVERTIIHELLHLVMAPIWNDDSEEWKQQGESVIHVLAGALVEGEEKVEHLQSLLSGWEGTPASTESSSFVSQFTRFAKKGANG